MGSPARPWFELMDDLRAKTGLTQDDVAFEARQHGAPSTFTGSWISQLRRGSRPLAVDVLQGIAGALGVEPEHFAEYRLARIRQLFDEREIGLKEAIRNLTALESLVADDGLPAPLGELARLLRSASPSSKDRQRGDSRRQSPRGKRKPDA